MNAQGTSSAAAGGKPGCNWSLERGSEKCSKITLKSGEAAYFGVKGVKYLPWAAGDSAAINVTKIELTPPSTTTAVTLPWSASVVLQDQATHPGTHLTPIALGTNP